MEPTRHRPGITPEEQAELDKKRDQRETQPYATEVENRELETAQKEKRPVSPKPAENP